MEQRFRTGREARLKAEQDCVLLKNRVALLRKETEKEQKRCQELVKQTKEVVHKRKRYEGDRVLAEQMRLQEERAAQARRQALLGNKEAQRSRIRSVANAVLREKKTMGAQEREYKGLLADAKNVMQEQHTMEVRAKHDMVRHHDGMAQVAKHQYELSKREQVRREVEKKQVYAERELMKAEGEAAQLEAEEIELMRQLEYQREQTLRAEEKLQQVQAQQWAPSRTGRSSTSAPPGAQRMPPLPLGRAEPGRMSITSRSSRSEDPFEWCTPPATATRPRPPLPPSSMPCGPRDQDGARMAPAKPQVSEPVANDATRFTYTTADGQVIDVSDSEDEGDDPPQVCGGKKPQSEASTGFGTPASCSPPPYAN
mmetsp:Transcript_12752/g.30519  ORF Transcript_12752/g.30519 Transcript_12752/m.30519 type:complete len:369 (-) Transcript_12752:80-1186(-)